MFKSTIRLSGNKKEAVTKDSEEVKSKDEQPQTTTSREHVLRSSLLPMKRKWRRPNY